MSASNVDPELVIEAILLHVQDLGEAGVDWLKAEFKRVFQSYIAGAETITSTSFEGQSTSMTTEVSTKELLAVLTSARKRLNVEDGGDPRAGSMLIPRLSDFSLLSKP